MTKICPRCNGDKPLSEFRRQQYFCKECGRKAVIEHRARVKQHPERYRKYRQGLNDYLTRYRDHRKALGRPLYIPMDERIRAIMQLI